MELGTKYKTIEDIVAILEKNLGIAMTMDEDGEAGVSYDWSDAPDGHGLSYHGISVLPTRIFDEESQRIRLRHKQWANYTHVISVSDELFQHVRQLHDLVANGVLIAEEIPHSR